MAWNYKDQGAPKLSAEFRTQYVISIKNKDCVKADGLQALAHEKGIRKLSTRLIQLPNKDNDNTAIAETTLLGYDWCPVTNQTIEVEYVAIGDANPKNCTAMVAASFIRMAETRAVSRVCKNYTNIGMLSVEEISTATDNIVPMITAQQIAQISVVMKDKTITQEMARSKAIALCNKSDLRTLTESEAEILIAGLNQMNDIAV